MKKLVEWVCEEVLIKVLIGILKVIVEYIFYILTWICWIIDWTPRGIDLLFCLFGLRNRRFLHVCVKVLAGDRRDPPWDLAEVERLLEETDTRLNQCNVNLCVVGFEIVETDRHRTDLPCGFGSLFTSHHHWFVRNECPPEGSIIPITIYFVESIDGARGCSIPGSNYVLVDPGASNATIAHELGHLADLWLHSDEPTNVMFTPTTNDSVNFTRNQCCMIRSSKYVTTASRSCD